LRKSFIGVLLIFLFVSAISAQTHNTVPVEQKDIYDFLEMAQIRGVIRILPSAKPYTLSFIASSLEELNAHRFKLSDHEKSILDDFIHRFVEDPDMPFSYDGDVRIEDDVFPTKFGAYIQGTVSADFNDFSGSLAGSGIFGMYAKGDIGRYVSWGIDATGGLFLCGDYDTRMDYGPTGYEPYTFSKNWDGGLHPINSLSSFEQMPTTLSGGYSFSPEIVASFWENRVMLRFGRSRHDWGIGEGNLFLSPMARPFFALETSFNPFKWLSISALTGELEYGETFRNYDDYHISRTAQEQQNMIAALQIEINPLDWLHLSFYDAAIYLKRPEFGYMFPWMSQFISQNNTGDFDNLMMGGTLGLIWPGVLRTYFSVFLDEARFNAPNFFHDPSNQYAIQAGVKMPIPLIPWSNLTFQYTKIEPFTYTHYYFKDVPGYTPPDTDGDGHPDYAMDTGYLNAGEGLGYGLEPNTDEFMLALSSHFRQGVTWQARYRMIRHGYPESVPGSTFDAWGFDPGDSTITPGSDPNGAYYPSATKDFLKDGVYEWFHIITLGGTLDMRIWNEPVQMGLSYSFVSKYYTDYTSNGNFKPLDSAAFPNTFRNIVSFTIGVSPY